MEEAKIILSARMYMKPKGPIFKTVIFLKANENQCVLQELRKSNGFLLDEKLEHTWGWTNENQGYKERRSEQDFDHPEDAINFGRQELERVYPEFTEFHTTIIKTDGIT